MKTQINKEQLTTEWATNFKDRGISKAQMLIECYPNSSSLLLDADLWPAITDDTQEAVDVDIITPKQHDWKRNVLELYSESVRQSVKFPPNTCFLHALGCLSAAMSRQFKYIPYRGSDEERPVNLFCVSGQPPSTGKSGINKAFINPIRVAYEAINSRHKIERQRCDLEISRVKREIKSSKLDNQLSHNENRLIDLAEKKSKLCDYVTDVKDATPEGLEKLMLRQDGWANIISDEAEAVEVVLGGVYGDAGKKANNGIFLAMWSGEWVSVQRSSREGYRGIAKGSCAVLAQPETINSVLQAGKLGRGISERFLVINETHLLGKRDHSKYIPTDKQLKDEYIELVDNLIAENHVILEFDSEAHAAIIEYRNRIELEMGDMGRYSDSMIRGTMGKAGDQIQKIACILWAANEWARGGEKRVMIGMKTTQRAIDIFDELSKTYFRAAEEYGCAGIQPKVDAVIKSITRRLRAAQKEKRIAKVTVQQLQQSLKTNREFKGMKGLTAYLRDKVMPELVKMNAVVLSGGEYYINPKTIEITEQ